MEKGAVLLRAPPLVPHNFTSSYISESSKRVKSVHGIEGDAKEFFKDLHKAGPVDANV